MSIHSRTSKNNSKPVNSRGKNSRSVTTQIIEAGVNKAGEPTPRKVIQHDTNLMAAQTIAGAKKAAKDRGRSYFKRGY